MTKYKNNKTIAFGYDSYKFGICCNYRMLSQKSNKLFIKASLLN